MMQQLAVARPQRAVPRASALRRAMRRGSASALPQSLQAAWQRTAGKRCLQLAVPESESFRSVPVPRQLRVAASRVRRGWPVLRALR